MTPPPATTDAFDPVVASHLHALWTHWSGHALSSGRAEPATRDWELDKTVIYGLGVGLEQFARFVPQTKTYAELEAWILQLNGGSMAAADMARLRAVLSRTGYDAALTHELEAIAAAPAVFSADEMREWDEQGVIVLHHAISAEECAAAVQAVHDCIDARADDPETWYQRRHCQGIMVQLFQHAALRPARTSARIHKAFAQLLGQADLMPTIDRCGWNPPEREGFQFPGPRLHWDADLSAPIELAIQGILYLDDTSAEQGSFCCVPGFHRSIDHWLKSLPADVKPQDAVHSLNAQAYAGKAGDLILWHQALPHGSSPNRAQRPRVVQYITMFPARP